MTSLVDSKYIALVSASLRNFKQRGNDLYNFSCPICQDSKKNKLKARGYFFPMEGKTFYKCHNCGTCLPLFLFLKELDYNLFRDYVSESLMNKWPKAKEVEKPIKAVWDKSKPIWDELTPILTLSRSHFAREYIADRKVPESKWQRIYYTSNFKKLVELADPEKAKNLVPEPRIVLPFLNVLHQIVLIQGRSLNPGSTMRYINAKVLDQPKVFGAECVDTSRKIYITEGPFDSLFLDNCIAAGGADVKYDPKISVWIYDNERTNPHIVSRMRKVIKEGHSIFIWPYGVGYKDINDWVKKGGIHLDKIQRLVYENTFSGAQALIKMKDWMDEI